MADGTNEIEHDTARHYAAADRAARGTERAQQAIRDGAVVCPECSAPLDPDREDAQGIIACTAIVGGETCEGDMRLDDVIDDLARDDLDRAADAEAWGEEA